ncbi:MAG: DUF2007 domain-containing protein [Phycisphaerales bacterium]|nr:DUF2007 domain-containing protein [Phycisphaerales bacterium]
MNENIKWIPVYKTNNRIDAEIMKGKIEHSGIACVVINKQDRSYLAFGWIELQVPETQKEAALSIINEISKEQIEE